MIGGWINIDSGFFFTIKELFIRPGYMINDYITGKRIRYFRPLQMLFVLGAVYVLLSQALYSSAESIISHDKENQEQESEHVVVARLVAVPCPDQADADCQKAGDGAHDGLALA